MRGSKSGGTSGGSADIPNSAITPRHANTPLLSAREMRHRRSLRQEDYSARLLTLIKPAIECRVGAEEKFKEVASKIN